MEITNGYVIFAIFLGFVGLVIFALRKKKALEQKSIVEIFAAYGEENVLLYDEKTMYYGLASKGFLQTHTQGGIFAITPDLLRFKSWDNGGPVLGVEVTFDFVIPLDRVQSFGMAKQVAALGPMSKMSGDGLFVIRFLDEDDEEDELALLLKTKDEEALALLEELTDMTPFKRT